VIVLRRGGKHADRALEVLMVMRNPEARFMPGVWVFPGGAVDAGEGEDEGAHRDCAVRELAEEAGMRIDAADLVPYSRWITPEPVPTRFDTYFYLALAPAHSPPKPDGLETVDAGWFEPADALARHRDGQMSLVFPTIKHLESLLDFTDAAAAMEAARALTVEPILPKVLGEGDERRIVLPGEPGYQN
jgi:8-oxo-dGTP pyrophosphatase MutT (NUDIX family)